MRGSSSSLFVRSVAFSFFASANYANITIRPPHLSEQNPSDRAHAVFELYLGLREMGYKKCILGNQFQPRRAAHYPWFIWMPKSPELKRSVSGRSYDFESRGKSENRFRERDETNGGDGASFPIGRKKRKSTRPQTETNERTDAVSALSRRC